MPSIRMKEGEIPAKQAAVLVPLCISNGHASLLYTLRSRAMSKNAGQISFPGGMRDDADADLVETAVREAHEELGIDRKVVDVWCMGKFIGTWDKSMGVMPVVGFVGEIEVNKLQINPKEVEEVFCVPLREFCNPRNAGYTKFLKGYSLPVFTYHGHQIWGLTAMITHVLLSALLQEKYTKHASKLFRFFTKVG
ncbi:hypothetical protein J437_LFUL016492 [Ladona fulva]|uniref:Nudix hydrolase domain-containing protein n=1 Tax=Ladona fulva TaxID=123851 RepID=A0A8K0PA77_LADFU|nr:hypothetical protein J437_LFUL016492 [Ladona fulva]